MKALLSGLAFVLLLSDDLDGHEASTVKAEKARICGIWKVVSAERDGKPIRGYVGLQMEMTDDQMILDKTEKASYTIDPMKDPKTVDLVELSGFFRGAKSEGIYKVEGNKLTICLGDKRPTDFSSKPGTRVLVYERVRHAKEK